MTYTPAQAYAEDVRRCPIYQDGASRPSWDELPKVVQWSWCSNPTPRQYVRGLIT